MLIYEKNKKIYGTETVPSDNDSEVVYKDASGNVITLNENDSYFDDGAGGMTRKSDNKTVDMLFNNKYIIPNGKTAPGPTPTHKTLTWDGDITGKTVVTIGDTLDIIKMSDDIPTTTQILGATIKVYMNATSSEISFEAAADNIINRTSMFGAECYAVVDLENEVYGIQVHREPCEVGSVTITPGIWFAKYIDATEGTHTTKLEYTY